MVTARSVRIPLRDGLAIDADLVVPQGAGGVIVFAHGSGSSRHSQRNRQVAEGLQDGGFATLLLDLLTSAEERVDRRAGHLRFDVELLADRLRSATTWIRGEAEVGDLPVGYFGASTGAAGALIAAADDHDIGAVVSRGGRVDLASRWLPRVTCPTLLIVGSRDDVVLELNRGAIASVAAESALEVVPGAGHLFEEPGALDVVVDLAKHWFVTHLLAQPREA